MITLISGKEKTGKTRFACTFPKPLILFEFDIGGFSRAKNCFKPEELAQITVKQFPSLLRTEFKSKSVIESLIIIGELERWRLFMQEFNTACINPNVKTVVLDTWFQVYELARQAYLQTLQEAQLDELGGLRKGETKLRESLQQVEYTQPYAKLRSIMFYAAGCKKHLVLVTYDADEYKPQLGDDGRIRDARTGRNIPAGWKETEKHADIALWTKCDSDCPVATITLAGTAPLGMVGAELPDNSYQALVQVLSLGGVELE